MGVCENCGSYIRETEEGLWCPKCKKVTTTKPRVETRTVEKRDSAAIFVADRSEDSRAKVSQTCPKCGNTKAHHWFSRISGEHAGIRRERTVEHFNCTKCSYSWSKSS